MIAITATKMPLRIRNALLFIPAPRFRRYYLHIIVMYPAKAFSMIISRKSCLVAAKTETRLGNLFFLLCVSIGAGWRGSHRWNQGSGGL